MRWVWKGSSWLHIQATHRIWLDSYYKSVPSILAGWYCSWRATQGFWSRGTRLLHQCHPLKILYRYKLSSIRERNLKNTMRSNSARFDYAWACIGQLTVIQLSANHLKDYQLSVHTVFLFCRWPGAVFVLQGWDTADSRKFRCSFNAGAEVFSSRYDIEDLRKSSGYWKGGLVSLAGSLLHISFKKPKRVGYRPPQIHDLHSATFSVWQTCATHA